MIVMSKFVDTTEQIWHQEVSSGNFPRLKLKTKRGMRGLHGHTTTSAQGVLTS